MFRCRMSPPIRFISSYIYTAIMTNNDNYLYNCKLGTASVYMLTLRNNIMHYQLHVNKPHAMVVLILSL